MINSNKMHTCIRCNKVINKCDSVQLALHMLGNYNMVNKQIDVHIDCLDPKPDIQNSEEICILLF